MYQTALGVLKTINEHGFQAYIVGGYPRDIYLKKESLDIDICTSATPKDIKDIFKESVLAKQEYGSVTVVIDHIRFEITTFRKEIKYENNRFPVKIQYIDNLLEDLLRRDFTMNTLCIDAFGNKIDLLNSRKDLDEHIIRCVGDTDTKIKEDILRSLRAIRFATILDFKLDKKLKKTIKKHGPLLKNLSYNRKKEELDKIFASTNANYGISLIKELKLDVYLEIDLKKLVITTNPLGIWAQINALKYPFSNYEKETIKSIQKVLKLDVLNNEVLYKHGLYICTLVGEIKNLDRTLIVSKYNSLPIHMRKDISITSEEICQLLNKKPDKFLKDIYEDLEIKILNNEIENEKETIKKYITDRYN